jgi:tRNA pseudouridine13 synthase
MASDVDRDRRALRVNVQDLQWQFEPALLELSFTLPAGSYATSVLREIIG